MLYYLIYFIKRCFDANYKVFRFIWQFIVKLDNLNEAFWLAVLSKEKLEGLIWHMYKHTDRYRKDEKTKQGLSDYEQYMVQNYVANPSTITIIGAGGGREVFSLAKSGHIVNAFEVDAAMVNYAQNFFSRENIRVSFNQLAANQVPNCACDVFWFGWGVYTHIIGRETRVELLRQAKETLTENGKIFITYWNESRNQIHLNRIERMSKRFGKRQVEQGESLRQGFWAKYFTSDQILQEATLAGLKVAYINEKPYGHAVLVPF